MRPRLPLPIRIQISYLSLDWAGRFASYPLRNCCCCLSWCGIDGPLRLQRQLQVRVLRGRVSQLLHSGSSPNLANMAEDEAFAVVEGVLLV